ncbi:rhodanese-like domain-containing protein [Jatrophihabitans telluris]|uniref:Rhodanese-like domain-containing protein n=1 Tax=Jatrophihabitans telluris TaxID=2038343 RepID=A0ABY4R0B7_9ACTN|nr:rhodanese-like domain-containing protein [Jatrophihabitans telluris]UQX88912.1 rhodanese-like domain-containing protein [Jatrophihabitans telluris]
MQPSTPTEISVDDAYAAVQGGAYLLDVREDHEWVDGHAERAVHIPMSELNARTGEIPTDTTVICVCHVGGRSAMVTDALNANGWQVLNLTGGMATWQARGYPVVDASGGPGQIG